jgi:peptidoglycan/LPS O-acetylase OafA/YrhL
MRLPARQASNDVQTPGQFLSSVAGHSSLQQYEGLELLRGIAAANVVVFHLSSRLDMAGLFYHGYLAVDLFFALSGFIIDKAYGRRLAEGSLTTRSFAHIRIIRLFPMILLGILIASAVDLFRPGSFSFAAHAWNVFIAAAFGMFLIPILWRTTLEHVIFPLNGPLWSLFFEAVANAVHAVVARARTSTEIFTSLMIASFIALVAGAVHHGGINFGDHPDNFWLGFPRVLFSYSAGVLIARKVQSGMFVSKWLCAALVSCMFAVPQLPYPYNAVADIAFVAIASPAVLICLIHPNNNTGDFLSRFCGEVSYPMYMIHYPIVRVAGAVLRNLPLSPVMNIAAALLITSAIAVASWIIFKLVDVPIRRWLRARNTQQVPAAYSRAPGRESQVPARVGADRLTLSPQARSD